MGQNGASNRRGVTLVQGRLAVRKPLTGWSQSCTAARVMVASRLIEFLQRTASSLLLLGRRWPRLPARLFCLLFPLVSLGVGCQHVFGDFEVAPAVDDTTNRLCRSGELRCNDEYLLACRSSEDGWQLESACLAADRCDSRGGHCLACTPGDVRCNGAAREGCVEDGSGWQALETCSEASLCNPSFCGPCPNLGDVRCAGGGGARGTTLLQRCVVNDGWQTIEECQSESLCALTASIAMDAPETWNNQCLPPGCPEPGALKCEGSTLYRCPQSQQTWVELDVCDSEALCQQTVTNNSDPQAGMLLEACESGCAPAGGLYCDGADLMRCRDDQTNYENLETCDEGLTCNPTLGACSGPCLAGEYRCNAARLEVCDSEQTWSLVQTCETRALCSANQDADSGVWSGSCAPATCGADEHRCDGETLVRCNDDRTEWVQDDLCANEALCEAENGRCRVPVCEAGVRRCNPSNPQQLEECNDDRTARELVETCPDDQACNPYPDLGPNCLAQCPGNPVRCVGATREVCSDATGRPVWSFDATCATEELCRCGVNGTCNLGQSGKCGAAVCGGTLPSFRCNGSLLERCAAGRHAWERSADCGSSDLCYAGDSTNAGSCLACPLAGEARCFQSQGAEVRRTCSANRSQWTSEQACSYGCIDDGTNDRCAVCFASELRCDQGGNLDICTTQEDALVDLLDCPYGCLNDSTGNMDECAACAAGESRCVSGNQRHTCSSDRRSLTLAETCEFSCLDDGLQDRCGECNDGDMECQGKNLQVCDGRVWKAEESCDLACISESSGADHCAEDCLPGVSDCVDATSRRTCKNDGSWASAETCMVACIDSGDQDFCAPACAPGARRCSGTSGQYQQCSAQGTWPSQSSACLSPTPACIGSGQCAACDPNTYAPSCNGATLRSCSTAGTLVDTPCTDACVVVGGSAGCRDCSPGATRCQDGNAYACSAQGTWPSSPSQTCGANGCYGDVPSAHCGDCAEGDTACTQTGGIGQGRICNAGSWVYSSDCAPYGCDDSGKQCAECMDGATRCSTAADPDGELSECDGGTWSAPKPCPAASGCATEQSCTMMMGSGGMTGSSASGSAGSSGSGGSSP